MSGLLAYSMGSGDCLLSAAAWSRELAGVVIAGAWMLVVMGAAFAVFARRDAQELSGNYRSSSYSDRQFEK